MLDLFTPIAAACDISIAAEHRAPVAVVGAGTIVDVAHLPAYRRAGLEIIGLFDLNSQRAHEVAAHHGVPRVYSSLEELLGDSRVRVVDIAVAPQAQPGIVRQAIAAGKHLLCQKPFVPDAKTGDELIDLAERAGLLIAVNQQLRYDEGMAAARAMAEAGWIGEVTAMTFTVNITTDWTPWPWLVHSDRLEIMYHSIHYFDSIRSILGTPQRVFCAAGRRPGQLATGETRTTTTLLYDDGRSALVNVNHENVTGDHYARLRVDGSRGSMRGTIGLLYDYPHGRPDTLEVNSIALPTDGWVPYPVTTRWIPGAFAGPMRALLAAIADGIPAPTSGADSLDTLRLVEACYAAIDSGNAQALPAP